MNSSSSSRLTSRQADAKDLRNRMTRRRQELTQKIRKQKKSEYLARKRNLTTGSTTTITTTSAANVEITSNAIHSYCQNPTQETLEVLHQSLQSTTIVADSGENPLVFISQEEQLKAVNLLQCLRTHATTAKEQLPLQSVLQVLVALTAISYTPSSDGYYGHIPVSWCTLLAQDVQWLSLLISLVSTEENACVVLGNLAGEGSSQVCPALRQAGMVRALVAAIHRYPATATWALTTAIRNDTTAWASTYCSDELLPPSLLEQLVKSQQPTVATQAAWMVASLTSREEAIVKYLVEHTTFCATLVQCLGQPISKDQSIPLVQALGHIASYEDLVPSLLSPQIPLVSLIGQLLMQQQQPKELTIHLSWLAGCLLCDARLVNHPSSTIASPTLVPILFQRLANGNNTLEEKREVACALQNALSLPPAVAANPDLYVVPLEFPSIDIIEKSLSTLVGLIRSVDSDAVLAALRAVNLLLCSTDFSLRRVLITMLEEANIESALELVCDNGALEEAAEVAANLLDDYFINEDDDEEEALPLSNLSFAFEPQPLPPQQQRPGMGRGRGATLPSWMLEN